MKIMISFFILILFVNGLVSQDHLCEHHPEPIESESEKILSQVFAYEKNLDCPTMFLKMNFVFLHRDNGSGNFPIGDEMISNLVTSMNDRFSAIINPAECASDFEYPFNTGIQFDIDVYHENNSAAWNYYGSHFNGSCPNQIVNENSLPDLKLLSEYYNNLYPDRLHVFFLENESHLDFLEDAIYTGVTPPSIWNNALDINVPGGCSVGGPADNDFMVIYNRYSGYLTRKHFKDLYFPNASNTTVETLLEWNEADNARLLNHELGHYLWNGTHEDCDCSMIMTQGTGCIAGDFLNSDDYLDIFSKLVKNRTMRNYFDFCPSNSDCLVMRSRISNDPTVRIVNDFEVFGDLIISEGDYVAIDTEVYFNENSRIIVEPGGELEIFENAKLTSASCSDTWKGIKVFGGQGVDAGLIDFDVKIRPGAIIENTSSAAVSFMPPASWTEIVANNYGNGRLSAQGAIFNNVQRIAEFISFSPQVNRSIISGCTQNGGKYSITNWNCTEVTVSGNTFNDVSDHNIVVDDAGMTINDNTMNAGENNILIANTSESFPSEITNNRFYSANVGIRSFGSSFDEQRISNNQFFTAFADIWMDGYNFYKIDNNDFYGNFGVISVNNGNRPNKLHDNSFEFNVIGNYPEGSNENYNFYQNCYTTSLADVYAFGSISATVNGGDDPTAAANNCFTHDGDASSTVFDITGSPSPFDYIEPNDQMTDCRDAINSVNNVHRKPDGDVVSQPSDCGAEGNILPPPPPYNPCNPKNTVSDLKNALNYLVLQVSAIENDPSISEEEKNRILFVLQRCIRTVKARLFFLFVQQEEYERARTEVYANVYDADALSSVYSTFVFENDLLAARNFLLNVPATSLEEQDFVEIQMMNLDRLTQGTDYVLSNSDSLSLRTLALTSYPYAAYGKALFYQLTGEVLASDLSLDLNDPMYQRPQNQTTPRSSMPSTSKEDVLHVYPNPFLNELAIDLLDHHAGTIVIVDMLGNIVYNGKIEKSLNINSESWQGGVYYILLKEGTKLLQQEKVVLIK